MQSRQAARPAATMRVQRGWGQELAVWLGPVAAGCLTVRRLTASSVVDEVPARSPPTLPVGSSWWRWRGGCSRWGGRRWRWQSDEELVVLQVGGVEEIVVGLARLALGSCRGAGTMVMGSSRWGGRLGYGGCADGDQNIAEVLAKLVAESSREAGGLASWWGGWLGVGDGQLGVGLDPPRRRRRRGWRRGWRRAARCGQGRLTTTPSARRSVGTDESAMKVGRRWATWSGTPSC